MSDTVDKIISLHEKLSVLWEEIRHLNNDLILQALKENGEKVDHMEKNLFNLADYIDRAYLKKNMSVIPIDTDKDVS